MNPQDLIDKALVLMNQHLEQLRIHSTFMTKDGPKGLTTYDSQVIERYTKLMLAMTKQTGPESDENEHLTDAELLAKAGLTPEETLDESETSEPE